MAAVGVARAKPALAVFVVSLLLLASVPGRPGIWQWAISACALELRADSRYNQDNQKIINSYSIGLDVMSVFVQVKGIEEGCLAPQVMRAIESFDFQIRSVAGVQSVQSVAGMGKAVIAGNNEGNPRWSAIPGSERGLSQGSRATCRTTAW